MDTSSFHPKLAAFLQHLDSEVGKLSNPLQVYVRHGALQPDRFDVIAKQGLTDIDNLNQLRAGYGMVALPRHANVQEIPADAKPEDHARPANAAKVVLLQKANGRKELDPASLGNWPEILRNAFAAHPEIEQPFPLYFKVVPKTSTPTKVKGEA